MPVEVKNNLSNPLSVGPVKFNKPGEIKIVDSIDGEHFKQAIKQGLVKVLEPRIESADVAKESPKEVKQDAVQADKEADKVHEELKQDGKEARVESVEIQPKS